MSYCPELSIASAFTSHVRVLPKTLCLLVIPLLTGCTHIDVKQVAYEVLRQEDCRINQLEDFCTRTFAREYLEYERMRRDFIRSQQQHTWRVSHDDRQHSREFVAQ